MASAILKRFKAHPDWADAERVLATLSAAGHQAVLAGGCVRDGLLGRPLNDFDIATSAIPDQVEDLFKKTVAVGKAFGVIKVIGRTSEMDVATFRSDGEYRDGRHPETVAFANLTEDARRRDFTINALFYSYADDKIIDVVGGERDLTRKLIRTVGSAEARFNEDSLRALRAIRFAAQLGFGIDDETWHAVEDHSSKLGRLARERQAEELRKLAASDFAPKGWELLRVAGLLSEIFPELSRRIQASLPTWHVALRGVAVSRHWPLTVTLGWFGYCFEFTPEEVGAWLKGLKVSGEDQSRAVAVTRGLRELTSENSKLMGRLRLLDADVGTWLLKLWPLAELPLTEARAEVINATVGHFRGIMETDGRLPKPWINGQDLLGVGARPGAQMGGWLEEAYEMQLLQAAPDKAALLRQMTEKIRGRLSES